MTAAFSMFVDTRTGQNANILFGAINKTKYMRELKTVKLTDQRRFQVAFTITGVSCHTIVDCRTSYTTLPKPVFEVAA